MNGNVDSGRGNRLRKWVIGAAILVGSLIVTAAVFLWWMSNRFYVRSPCEASSDARKIILSKLKPEEALTLRIPAMDATGNHVSCPPSFIYTSHGKDIEISFLVDAIHGLKFSSDDAQTADMLRKKSPNR